MNHSELTALAKEISQTNKKLIEALFAVTELVTNNELLMLLHNQESQEYKELCEKVGRYSQYESSVNLNDPALDDIQKILSPIFAKAFP